MPIVPGQTLSLTIEKPAVGGWMIARSDGQVVLVDGAIPGERVSVTIDRTQKGVAYGRTVGVELPSPDRQMPPGDRTCGGCLYAHIAYPSQLQIKADVIADAFARIGRLTLGALPTVRASSVLGYRMRARLHRRAGRIGFFREHTHEVCDARATGQLLASTCDVLDRLADALDRVGADMVREIEVSENVDASERVIHLDNHWSGEAALARGVFQPGSVTGLSATSSIPGVARVLFGSPYVADALEIEGTRIAVRRHVSSFFQGNRFLLRDLVAHVADQVPRGSHVIDLYAGGGLFALAAGRLRDAKVTAVEGDRLAASDLAANAASDPSMKVVHRAVEDFVQTAPHDADVLIVDPPRTGMSPEALQGTLRLRARRLVYVSCDVATLARDARRLVEAGYAVASAEAFDLFPNTPHVETIVVFEGTKNTSGTRGGTLGRESSS